MRIRSLDHLVLTVSDIAATVRFYESLGMRREVFGEERVALRFGNQKLNLHEVGAELIPHAAHPAPGSADLCFLVADDLDQVAKLLVERGIPVRTWADRSHGRYISLGLALHPRSGRQSRQLSQPFEPDD